MRALFLTWDGPQQSYLESLFFPIFAGLGARGIEVHTLQLTWASREQLEPVRSAAARLGLQYSSARIPPALRRVGLPLSIAFGAGAAQRHLRREAIEVLFPRSLIPMSMALLLKSVLPGLDLVFEADGLMADERADFGGWSKSGPSYRLLRRVEAQGVRHSRAVVCRTAAAREILIARSEGDADRARAKIFVAPNAKDATEFSPGTPEERAQTRARHGVAPGVPWVVYVGSLGPQYLPEQMVAAMAHIRRRVPATHFSFFTFQEATIRALLAAEPELAAVTTVRTARPAEIPLLLAAADLGFALRLEALSQRAICPIKVAEYLLCGLPVVASHVGDLPEQLAREPAAFMLSRPSPATAEASAEWFANHVLPQRDELRASARALGLKWFDLARSVETYERVLRHQRPDARP